MVPSPRQLSQLAPSLRNSGCLWRTWNDAGDAASPGPSTCPASWYSPRSGTTRLPTLTVLITSVTQAADVLVHSPDQLPVSQPSLEAVAREDLTCKATGQMPAVIATLDGTVDWEAQAQRLKGSAREEERGRKAPANSFAAVDSDPDQRLNFAEPSSLVSKARGAVTEPGADDSPPMDYTAALRRSCLAAEPAADSPSGDARTSGIAAAPRAKSVSERASSPWSSSVKNVAQPVHQQWLR